MPLRIYGATSGYVDLDAPAVAGSASVTLPGSGTLATQAYADGLAGLTLITTQSFTSAASVSVNNCFSSTYRNYRFLYQLSGTATANLFIRMRASGSDFTSSLYTSAIIGLTEANGAANTTSAGQVNGGYLTDIYGPDSAQWISAGVDVLGPALSEVKVAHFIGVGRTGAGALTLKAGVVCVNTSTTFDGFTMYPSSGNITGTLRVYGYKN